MKASTETLEVGGYTAIHQGPVSKFSLMQDFILMFHNFQSLSIPFTGAALEHASTAHIQRHVSTKNLRCLTGNVSSSASSYM